LRKEEGLRPGMSPDEVTNHIMANRDADQEADMVEEAAKPGADAQKPVIKTEKSEPKAAKSESKSPKSESNTAKSEVSEGQHDMFGEGPASGSKNDENNTDGETKGDQS